MTKFRRSSKEPYTLITPLTPLSDLEEFLKATVFALGERIMLFYQIPKFSLKMMCVL